MTADELLGRAFLEALKNGTSQEIEESFYEYRSYVRNIKAFDYYLPYNYHLELFINEKWEEYNERKSHKG